MERNLEEMKEIEVGDSIFYLEFGNNGNVQRQTPVWKIVKIPVTFIETWEEGAVPEYFYNEDEMFLVQRSFLTYIDAFNWANDMYKDLIAEVIQVQKEFFEINFFTK